MDLNQVDVWAADARLIVNEGGQSSELTASSLPRIPVYRGRLANQSTVGGGVSAVVLADSTLRVHVYEAGEDLVLESADHFDRAPTLARDDYIVYRTPSMGEHGTDEVLHQSDVPKLGLHSAEEGVEDPGRQLSLLNTLPTGPPFGRLSSCVASPAFYTNKIGILVDRGFAGAAGGTTSAVTSEVASVITQTNVIFTDQVGVEFSLGTLIVNLDASASLASGGPNFAPTSSGTRTCGGDLDESYTSRSVLQYGTTSTMVTVEEKGGASKLLGHLANWVGLSGPVCSGCSHWHLLTDCFPPSGTVGIAYTGVSCNALQSKRGVVSDSGSACSGCDVRMANGNAANVAYLTATECLANEWICAQGLLFGIELLCLDALMSILCCPVVKRHGIASCSCSSRLQVQGLLA